MYRSARARSRSRRADINVGFECAQLQFALHGIHKAASTGVKNRMPPPPLSLCPQLRTDTTKVSLSSTDTRVSCTFFGAGARSHVCTSVSAHLRRVILSFYVIVYRLRTDFLTSICLRLIRRILARKKKGIFSREISRVSLRELKRDAKLYNEMLRYI